MIPIDQLINQAMEKHHVPGLALAVIHWGESRLVKGYGYANLEHDLPVTEDTVFEIASLTKMFTATAVLQLVQDGKIALEDPIGRYLADLPNHWQPITIRHILAHQSGIKSYTEVPEYWETTRLDISRQAILDLVADLPLLFDPGEKHSYDNTGYYLLGLLLENVTGQTYGEVLKNRIFNPLRMHSTRVNDPYAIVKNRAAGYSLENGELKNKAYYSTSGTFSAGVLLSSVADLVRWERSFYSDQLLSEKYRRLMWTPHPSKSGNEKQLNFVMCLGWYKVTFNNRQFLGHNGNILGFTSSLAHYPDEKYTIITLYNQGSVDMPHDIAMQVAEWVLGDG